MVGHFGVSQLQRFGQWIWSCARRLRGPDDVIAPLRCPIELLEPRAMMSVGWDVALIDRNLPNESILERAMLPGGHVITYDAQTESADEVLGRVISWAESTGSKIQSLSLLAHAAPGRFALGNQWVTRSTLRESAMEWEALGRVMAPGGSINLYGCSLADPHGDGKALIDRIAFLTQAGVFANTDITGRGGDWTLDVASKDISAVPAHFVNMFNTAVLVTYPDSLGVLSGSSSDTAAAVNLTTAGAEDWIHGGNNSGSSVDVKATGGSQISDITTTGSGGSVSSYYTDPRPISWTDGSPDASHTETAGSGGGYLAQGPTGYGFTLTAPADTTTRQLQVYVGGQGGGVGTLTAHLSDSSSADYTDTWTSSGNADRTYTLDYSAASAGQTLTVTWTLASSNPVGGGITISGAALKMAPTVTTAAAATPNPVTGTTADLGVAADDDEGSASLTYTWAATGTPPAAVTFSDNGDNSAQNATATFTAAGTYNLQVAITDSDGLSTISPVTVDVSQTFTSVSIWPGPQIVPDGTSFTFGATALDQFGTPLTSQPAFTWAVAGGGVGGSVNSATGNYTAPSTGTGTDTLTATASGISASVPITVSPPLLYDNFQSGTGNWTVLSGTFSTVNDGGAERYQADSTSGVAVAQAGQSSWANYAVQGTSRIISASGQNGPRLFGRIQDVNNRYILGYWAGPQTFVIEKKVNGASITVATSALTYPIAPNTDFVMTFVMIGTTLQGYYNGALVVSATDSTYSAGYAGLGSSGAVTEWNEVSVTGPAPTVVNPAAATPSTVTGTTTALSVLGDDVGGESGLTYTWAATSEPPGANPQFSANGTNAAQNTTVTFNEAGSYTFTCTITNPTGLSTTSSIGVSVVQTLSSISIVPGTVVLNETQSQQFAATGYDQFGQAMAPQPPFTWSIGSGGGSITGAGLYTAPSSAVGPAVVTAASAGVSGNAAVTLAAVAVSPTSGLSTSTAGGQATVQVSLTSQPAADVTLPIASSDTSQGTVSTSSLTFTSVNWNVPQTVTVTGVNDHVADGNQIYTVSTGPASSSDGTYVGLAGTTVSLTNVNYNVAGIAVTPTSGLATSQAGGTATFSVALTSKPLSDVTVPIASSDTTQGAVLPAALVFTSADWDVPQTVTVAGADDHIAGGDRPYTVSVGPAASTDGTYSGLAGASVSLVNRQTDTPGITVSPAAGLVTTADGGTASFTVVLTTEPVADVTIPSSVSDADEASASGSSLTFTAADWNVPQSVTLTGLAISPGPDGGGDVPFAVDFAPAVSADPNYAGMNIPSLAVVNYHPDLAPVVTASPGDVSYVTGTPPNAPEIVDPGLDVTDADNVDLQSASVSIGSGYDPGQDVLSVAAQMGISAQWDRVTGTLLLSGPAPVAAYQAALRSVSYQNTGDIPDAGTRVVDFTASDGPLNSLIASRRIDVSAGQSPYNMVPDAQATDQGSPLVFSYSQGNPLLVGDVAAGAVSVTLAARKGTITLSQTDGLTFAVGTGTANITMSFTGSIADVNAALEGLQFQPNDGYSGPASLRITSIDIGYRGQGGAPQAQNTVTIDVRPTAGQFGVPVQPIQFVAPPPDFGGTTTTDQPQPLTINPLGPLGPGQINGNPLLHRLHGGGAGTTIGASGDGGEEGDGGAPNPIEPKGTLPPAGPRVEPRPSPKPPTPQPDHSAAPRRANPVVAVALPAVPAATSDFWRQLDQVGHDLDSQQQSTQLTVGSTSAVTALMSIGYVIWAVRGASMAASFLATLPMWRWMDPLPVLESWEAKKKKVESETDDDDDAEKRLWSLTEETE